MKHIFLVLVIASHAGCSDDPGDDPSNPANPDGAPSSSDAAAGDVRSVSMGPIAVPAGVERTECIAVSLGNDEPAMIRSIRTTLTSGSHHMVITKASGAPSPTPRLCSPFGVAGDTLFIAEKAEAELRYPAGAGLQIAAQQPIGIEIHYINASGEGALEVTGTVEFELAPIDAGLREVALLFTGDFSLTLPPMTAISTTGLHEVPDGAEIFGLTSHTHRLGTYASIHRARSVSDPGVLLHESFVWSEPPLDVFDPPFVLDPDEGLKLTCEYFNTTDQTVTFGTSALDEMCFLWAHYVVPE